MVKYYLIEENEKYLVYHYFPEGKRELSPGIIIVNLEEDTIEVTQLAETDWENIITVEELNELVLAINEVKKENRETDYLELATEPESRMFYGTPAIIGICEELQKNRIPKEGIKAWY